ncbi:MAG: hypothetical protein K0R73_351 [Candidatus Midichloriaceae bacterium]|jgi:hypothetical protein|nr:hypothetical protein [Candidatus Midichloriaceae bacterium]
MPDFGKVRGEKAVEYFLHIHQFLPSKFGKR